MNNGLKALLIAASTIITCIIVGLGFSLAKEAKQIGNYVVEELHDYRNTVEERDFMKYDGVTVYGADVVNLLKKELSDDETEIRITVNESGVSRSYETGAEAEAAFEYENPAYIAPVSEYVGCVKRDENEVIVEILFTRKE
ncbi:MAG: hypothetical protein IJW37_05980 [Lachnospiraceae bacterium]|nr:hypothetical protein [Lachnospiraceae bacterium]